MYKAGKLLAGVAHITELSMRRGFKISKAQYKSNESCVWFIKKKKNNNFCVSRSLHLASVNSSLGYRTISAYKKNYQLFGVIINTLMAFIRVIKNKIFFSKGNEPFK